MAIYIALLDYDDSFHGGSLCHSTHKLDDYIKQFKQKHQAIWAHIRVNASNFQ
jgi:hypothetical protein